MTLTPEVLEELERLEREATGGEWTVEEHGGRKVMFSGARTVLGYFGDVPMYGHGLNLFAIVDGDANTHNDLKLLPAMRNALPDLLAAARELEATKADRDNEERWANHYQAQEEKLTADLQQTKRALKLAQAVIDTLPKCNCGKPAAVLMMYGYYCDEHCSESEQKHEAMSYAEALRALSEAEVIGGGA